MAERDGVKRGPDVITLVVGVLTLGVSAFVLTDGNVWFPVADGRWYVAGAAVLIGIMLLVAGGRRRRR